MVERDIGKRNGTGSVSILWRGEAGGGEGNWADRRMENKSSQGIRDVHALADGDRDMKLKREEKPVEGKGAMRQIGEKRRKKG